MASPRTIVLRGVALHGGGPVEARLTTAPGPLTIAQRGVDVAVSDLRVVRADRGVTLASADGHIHLDLVEHLFAALGGLGVHDGVRIATDDAELPLLDGGARRFADAVLELELATSAPALTVACAATIARGSSVYRFAPSAGVHLRVDVDFRAPVGRDEAAWDGDARDFVDRIAPARTFGWADEHAALLASGRAAGLDLASVLVFDERGALPGCRPAAPSEAARHKLLDLVGDLAIHGGPPRGVIEASRPGHAVTHAIVLEAIERGVLVCDAAQSSTSIGAASRSGGER